MKLWDKGYGVNKSIETYTVGNDYVLDKKLVKYDCMASIAHAKMLGKIGVLDKNEVNKLTSTLNQIIDLSEKDKFDIKPEDEDCHTAIENYLVSKLGAVGKKIHTARSRNDQVATALRLYYKEELKSTIKDLSKLIANLEIFAKKYSNVEMPGYTHMRKAMPSSMKMWSEAFSQSLNDDKVLAENTLKLIDQSPLGTGAGYGLPINVDRTLTTKLLGFTKTQESPIYTQNSRGKFEALILNTMSQILLDLNRMASDIILFSMPEFGYFELPKELSTGSSIMPHKKNPDVLELVRSKYHQVVGYQFQVMGMSGNLISGYNRDMQLTKEPTMNGIDTTKDSINIMGIVVNRLKVDKEACRKAMSSELYSVSEAYKLVKEGVPFRDAYKKVGKRFD
ncbi:MAG: argininosuccinate lyase [Candidatus Marsarchaeota archaeon]|nr:argininosuccinate lyase [Candidatus Marsarchaeota archaeon]